MSTKYLKKISRKVIRVKVKKKTKERGEIRLQWKRGDNYIMTFISVRTQITEN